MKSFAWVVCSLVVLILAPMGALGSEAEMHARPHYRDELGDAPAAQDITILEWSVASEEGADQWLVSMYLAGDVDEGAGYTAILFVGEGGNESRPSYILHHGPGGDHVIRGDAPDQNVTFDVSVADGSITWTFAPGFGNSDCAFAVGRTVTYHEGGQQVEDVVGWADANIQNAGARSCTDVPEVHIDLDDNTSIPAPAVVYLVIGLGALARLRRP